MFRRSSLAFNGPFIPPPPASHVPTSPASTINRRLYTFHLLLVDLLQPIQNSPPIPALEVSQLNTIASLLDTVHHSTDSITYDPRTSPADMRSVASAYLSYIHRVLDTPSNTAHLLLDTPQFAFCISRFALFWSTAASANIDSLKISTTNMVGDILRLRVVLQFSSEQRAPLWDHAKFILALCDILQEVRVAPGRAQWDLTYTRVRAFREVLTVELLSLQSCTTSKPTKRTSAPSLVTASRNIHEHIDSVPSADSPDPGVRIAAPSRSDKMLVDREISPDESEAGDDRVKAKPGVLPPSATSSSFTNGVGVVLD